MTLAISQDCLINACKKNVSYTNAYIVLKCEIFNSHTHSNWLKQHCKACDGLE